MPKNNSKGNNKKESNSKETNKKETNKKETNKKEKFQETTYTDVIDLLSVSPSALDKKSVTWQDQMQDYFILLLKYSFLVIILTLNFLGLSVSLNCNANEELFKRILSAVFAFFFGFVYLIINYYTYKVLTQGKICKMDRDKLFPFKV
jgi:hypothetical protein